MRLYECYPAYIRRFSGFGFCPIKFLLKIANVTLQN